MVAVYSLSFVLPPAIDTPSGQVEARANQASPPPGASAEALMTAYVAGNAEAFDELYRLLSPKLFGYLLRLTRHRERAEDLLQVTFSKIHRARASYLNDSPLLPWVLAIARRSFYDEVRQQKARREELSKDGALPEPTQPAPDGELADVLERALSEIPEVYREPIILTKVTGLSLAEAADVVGATPSAVKLRVHRGYKILREVLERLRAND